MYQERSQSHSWIFHPRKLSHSRLLRGRSSGANGSNRSFTTPLSTGLPSFLLKGLLLLGFSMIYLPFSRSLAFDILTRSFGSFFIFTYRRRTGFRTFTSSWSIGVCPNVISCLHLMSRIVPYPCPTFGEQERSSVICWVAYPTSGLHGRCQRLLVKCEAKRMPLYR
jgi:hypothetical protein